MAGKYIRFRKSCCEFCGRMNKLEVHHARMTRKAIIEQWNAGLISLETALYLINDAEKDYLTLCRCCHESCGHQGDWDQLNIKAPEICRYYGKR